MVPLFSSTCCELLHFLHFLLSMDVDQSASLPTFLEMVTRYQSIQSLRPTNVGLPVLFTLVVRYPVMLQDTDLEKRWNKSKTYILDSYLFRGLIRFDNAWYWRWLNFKEPWVLKSASLHHFPEKTQSQMWDVSWVRKDALRILNLTEDLVSATYEKVDLSIIWDQTHRSISGRPATWESDFFPGISLFTTFEYVLMLYTSFSWGKCISKKV